MQSCATMCSQLMGCQWAKKTNNQNTHCPSQLGASGPSSLGTSAVPPATHDPSSAASSDGCGGFQHRRDARDAKNVDGFSLRETRDVSQVLEESCSEHGLVSEMRNSDDGMFSLLQSAGVCSLSYGVCSQFTRRHDCFKKRSIIHWPS